MRAAKLAGDPLWQCLCPSWSYPSRARNSIVRSTLISSHGPKRSLSISPSSRLSRHQTQNPRSVLAELLKDPQIASPAEPEIKLGQKPAHTAEHGNTWQRKRVSSIASMTKYASMDSRFEEKHLKEKSTPELYTYLRDLAASGQRVRQCQTVVEYLVEVRHERPNLDLYNALISSNVSHQYGEARQVHDLLLEMQQAGLEPDMNTCNAVLKVLAVHPDHLLRSDVLEYMRQRWFQLSQESANYVAAGLWREGLYEQALLRMDMMRNDGIRVEPWLLDIAVYTLCHAGELDEATRIMRQRLESGEPNVSPLLWYTLLDTASEQRHYHGTLLAWRTQVEPGYNNPSSGICLNAMATAARASDAVLTTDIFTHLTKRETVLKPIHYEHLISCYMTSNPPDLNRAIEVLVIMAEDKPEPSPAETRSLVTYLLQDVALVARVLDQCNKLHAAGRNIPIVLLNALIEVYVDHKKHDAAVDIYKQMHTFAPPENTNGRPHVNVHTFNLLLKGCREVNPPDLSLASFLVAELLVLRIKPDALTFDRLILVFTESIEKSLKKAGRSPEALRTAAELAEWSYRHFHDMIDLGWAPRLGTITKLASILARLCDERCWDVLQASDAFAEQIPGWKERKELTAGVVRKQWGTYMRHGAQASPESTERMDASLNHGAETSLEFKEKIVADYESEDMDRLMAVSKK